MKYYSATTNGFYDSQVHGDIKPDDCVELTEKQYVALINGQSAGLVITVDADGAPVLIERVLTPKQIGDAERLWRDDELKRVDIEIRKVEDPLEAFNALAWRRYAVLLRDWPIFDDFPDSTKRPVAPDAV